MTYKKVLFTLFLLSTLIVSACNSQNSREKIVSHQSKQLLGTIITAEVYGENSKKSLDLAFQRVEEIENKMSRHLDTSEVSLINRHAGEKAVPISEDTYFIIQLALDYAVKTDGTFNPVIGNIVELWGIGTENEKVPSKEEIDAFLPYLDYSQLLVTKDPYTAQLMSDKIKLDLGGIAKGYAGDEMARILTENGITSAILNLGGNVLVIGNKPNGDPWTIGIQDPNHHKRGEIAGIIQAKNTSVVTSGSYERFFMEDNIRYHHIMDPSTGYPSENGVISSTIITEDSAKADALSTAVYVLGLKKGLALIESLPKVEAIMISDDQHVHATSGISDDIFTLKGEGFYKEK